MSGLNEHQRRMIAQRDQLNRYIATMQAPKELRQKLREYFQYFSSAQDIFNERRVLSMLSPGLRSDLVSLANAPLLRRVPILEGASKECISELAQLLSPNLFVPDEVIIAMGCARQCLAHRHSQRSGATDACTGRRRRSVVMHTVLY